jgi:hypothetical protein
LTPSSDCKFQWHILLAFMAETPLRAAIAIAVVMSLQSDAVHLQGSTVMEAIEAFDRNHNHKVDRSEIESFAKSQGLAAEDVLGDFREIDINGDGELDADEIAEVLQSPGGQPVSQPQATSAHPGVELALAEKLDSVAKPLASGPSIGGEAPVGTVTHSMGTVSGVAASKGDESKQIDVLLDATSVEQDAQQQAGSLLARNFAEKAKQLLMQSNSDDKSAAYYETLARSLRGNMQSILKRSDAEMKHTAKEATVKSVQDALPRVQDLQSKASGLSHKAGEHRTLAHQAMDRVVKAQYSMAKILH